jgi:hypothetical protein
VLFEISFKGMLQIKATTLNLKNIFDMQRGERK